MDQNNQLRGVLPELPHTASVAEKRILKRGRNFASKRMLTKSSTGTHNYFEIDSERKNSLILMLATFLLLLEMSHILRVLLGLKDRANMDPKDRYR